MIHKLLDNKNNIYYYLNRNIFYYKLIPFVIHLILFDYIVYYFHKILFQIIAPFHYLFYILKILLILFHIYY